MGLPAPPALFARVLFYFPIDAGAEHYPVGRNPGAQQSFNIPAGLSAELILAATMQNSGAGRWAKR